MLEHSRCLERALYVIIILQFHFITQYYIHSWSTTKYTFKIHSALRVTPSSRTHPCAVIISHSRYETLSSLASVRLTYISDDKRPAVLSSLKITKSQSHKISKLTKIKTMVGLVDNDPMLVKCWSQIKQISVIFTHLKLWVAVARHNFKWVKI